MNEVEKVIKERRLSLSITQRELAALAGIGINTLTKIERGEANPSLAVIDKIFNTLGLEVEIKIKDAHS